METLTDRTVRISIVYVDKATAKDKGGGIGVGKGDEKSDLLGDDVRIGNQRFSGSGENSELSTIKRV